MKQLKLLFTVLFLAVLGLGNVWGETATLTFTAACGGSGTDDKGNSWTVTSDAAESAYDGTKGIHYGTGKLAVSNLTLTTDGITGTITKIVVKASGASGTSAKLDVKVNGTAYGTQQSLTSTATDYTLTGSATGGISIVLSQTSATKALYVKSVEVTYSTGGDPDPEPTKYTVTVASSIANGTVTADPTSAKAGDNVTLTATPSTGYEFGSWNVINASTSAAITVTDNKFQMPAANVNVSATFNEKVVRPENEIFYESFNTNDGTGGNDNQWSGSIASNNITQDNEGWEYVSAKGANKCAKFGAGSTLGSATTPAVGQACNATLTFKAAAWNGSSESTTLKLSVVGSGSISPATVTMDKGAWKDFEVTLTNLTADSKIKFEGNAASNSRFFLDEVSIVKTGAPTPVASFTVAPASVDFGSVDKDATVEAQDVTVTLTNTSHATATLSGTNAAAFEIVAGAELTESGVVSVRPTAAALAVGGTYTASLDVEADGVTGAKSVALSLTVIVPFTGETWEITASDLAVLDANQSSGYAKYAGTQTKDGVDYNITAVMPQTGNMQMQKNTGVLYNESTFGKIAKIVVTSASTVLSLYEGEDVAPAATKVTGVSADGDITYTLSGDNGYFKLVNGNGTTTISKIIVYYYPVKSTITLATCTNGSVGASATTEVKAGTEITLSNTPNLGYNFVAYDVYKTGETATKVTVTDGKFTMPAYDVTVSATFEVAKVLDGTVLTLGGEYPTEFWKGDAFSHDGLTASALFNTGAADVTSSVTFSTPDMTTAGTQTITVTYTEGGASQTATYDITVKTIANTQETAYTTAEAINIIVAGKDLSSEVYVKGKVSQVDSYSSQYKSITYWLDDNAFEVYGGLAGEIKVGGFTSVDDIAVGADVIVKGTITDYKKNGVHQAYEFNANNVLVFYEEPEVVKTNPDLAIAGYLTTMSADDEADEVTYTKEGDGVVSATSSNETVATVEVGDGIITVTPLAAGTTTITVSVAETETYSAGSKTYTLTVKAGLAAATLPFTFDGVKADMSLESGIKHSGLGSDYGSSPKLKFDNANDEVVIRVAEAIKKVTYTVKANTGSGDWAGQFDVLQSADGKVYTSLASLTSMAKTNTVLTTDRPAADTRYIKFVLTTQTNGNVALGAINITAASVVDPAELEFAKASYRFVTTDEMVVAATSKAGSTGAITYSCEDANLTIDAETGVITCTTAGTYTINAAIAATGDYMAGNASCTVKIVESAVANSIIVAETTDGKVFAMTNTFNTSYIESVEIEKVGEKYVVSADNYNSILYSTTTVDGKTTIVSMSNMYLQATAAKNVSFTETEYLWTLADDKLTAAETAHGTLQYNTGSPRFTTYATKVGQYAQIVSLENVIIGEKWTREFTNSNMGTHCYPFTIKAGEYSGASFFTPAYCIGTSKLYWDEVIGDIEAGKPYLIVPDEDATEFVAVRQANSVVAPVAVDYGMVGSFNAAPDYLMVPNDGTNYIVLDNQFRLAGAYVAVGQYRAYIHLTDITNNVVAEAPGRRRIEMSNASAQVVTGLESIVLTEEAQKLLINGQLHIIRGGKMFNAAGLLVK